MQRISPCFFALMSLATGCQLYFDGGDSSSSDEASDELPFHTVAEVFTSPIRDLDLLFVIDNSGSMRDEQESLAAWSQDALFGVLKTQALEDFNLHVAVVSTDVGAGPYGIMGCENNGDAGIMSNTPRVPECSGPSGPYIINLQDGDGARIANHEGTVSEAFSCIAPLGTTGCGFEQPLAAMKRALDGSNPANAGFLRPDALLAVVIVSDEDDCSAEDVAVYDSDPGREDQLGPLASFRCFEYGVICEPDDPRRIGPRESCRSREDSPYMASIAGYSDFLKSLKADPSLIVVGGITGPGDGVVVEQTAEREPRLTSLCGTLENGASPAIRLHEFFGSFPARNTIASICNESLRRPLAQVAERITATANQSPCLLGPITDMDADTAGLQMDCRVAMVTEGVASPLAPCSDSSQESCYRIEREAELCAATSTQLAVRVPTASTPESPGTHIQVRCR